MEIWHSNLFAYSIPFHSISSPQLIRQSIQLGHNLLASQMKVSIWCCYCCCPSEMDPEFEDAMTLLAPRVMEKLLTICNGRGIADEID